MFDVYFAFVPRAWLTLAAKELEFLADSSVITRDELSSFLNQLPAETSLTGTANGTATVPSTGSTRTLGTASSTPQPAVNEKQNGYYNPPPTAAVAPPPAYGTPVAPPPVAAARPVLTYAVALYVYNATDIGDLTLEQHDRVAVSEYMNGEWWKGRNERTGQEGIFPRSYVRVAEDKGMTPTPVGAYGNVPPPQSGYGNMPMDVSQGAAAPAGAEDPKKKGAASKIGGKLGNAAIFGAGGEFMKSSSRIGLRY
jgi:LAS seventeen-binding protein 1/2